MNLLVLHLSDIHFAKDNAFSEKNVKGIVASLQKAIHGIREILIIVSGDIVFSGTNAEYKKAEDFFERLQKQLSERYDLDKIDILIVPGNHDVNYSIGTKLDVNVLKSIEADDKYDELLEEELKKQSPFFSFSEKFNCFPKKKRIVDIHTLEYGKYILQVNLINTAVFSSLDEDQGFHYMTASDVNTLSENRHADYVFSVMHHPHHWYNWRVKKKLEAALYQKGDVLFIGHEHYSSVQNIEANNAAVSMYAGGQLSNKGNWDVSQFYIGILNLETRSYSVTAYTWDYNGEVYCEGETRNCCLAKNRANSLEISPKEEYVKGLFRDTKYAISQDISSYFVFPLLEEVSFSEEFTKGTKEIEQLNELCFLLEEKRKLCILGHGDDGKSTLAKMLYKKYSQNKIVLFIDADQIRRGRAEGIIRDAFYDAYSEDSIIFEKFKQLPLDEKILILDDVDLVDDNTIGSFLEYAESNFGYVIQTSRQNIEFNIIERFNKRKLMENYSFFAIRPFYLDRRKELITKLVNLLLNQDYEYKNNIIDTLSETLSKRRGIFSWNPDFIVQFTKYYCTNIGESIQNDGDVYSKVFESNLTSLIKPYLKKMTADKAFIILDKIAYRMHVDKMDPISLQKICEVIGEYNEVYDAKVDADEFVHMLIDAGIIKKLDGHYKFTQRNYLAYFIAREIKRRCLEEGDYFEFTKALQYACYEINSDIILFVTYITDNINMINRIMDVADEYAKTWDEFTANPIEIPYLADSNQLQLPVVTEEDKKREEKQTVEYEKNAEKTQGRDYLESAYDYEEGELRLMDELIRSMSLMMIISRILPNFEHMMLKAHKEKCVRIIYSLPLRIFNIWAKELESVKLELIEEIKGIDDFRYRKDKLFSSDDKVLSFLRWESMSLLLDLMNCSIRNASKDNTYGFIDKFPYSENVLYRIEHLMELSKRDAVDAFDKEVCQLYDDVKQNFTKVMIQRVTRNYIINSRRISNASIQRLNAKIFNNHLKNPTLLMERSKKKKERD